MTYNSILSLLLEYDELSCKLPFPLRQALGNSLSPIPLMASIFLTYQQDKRTLSVLLTLSGGRECLPRGIRIARQHGWLGEFLLAVQGRPYFIKVSIFHRGLPRGICTTRQYSCLPELILSLQDTTSTSRQMLFHRGSIFSQKVSSRAPSAHKEGGAFLLLTLGSKPLATLKVET